MSGLQVAGVVVVVWEQRPQINGHCNVVPWWRHAVLIKLKSPHFGSVSQHPLVHGSVVKECVVVGVVVVVVGVVIVVDVVVGVVTGISIDMIF